MDAILSPITNMPCKIVAKIDSEKIKDIYLSEFNVDVTEYFTADITNVFICECPQTLYRFYYPAIVGKPEFYTFLYNYDWYYVKWKWENEQSLKYINKQDKILDVGCGSGLFLLELKARGFQNLNGLDNGILDEKIFTENNIFFNNNTIEKFSTTNENTFDVITCFQILEHIQDVKIFLETCQKMLKPNGKLIIAVPNCNPYLYKNDMLNALNMPPHHQGLWNRTSLNNMAHFFSLKTIDIKTQPIGNYLGFYTDIQKNRLKKQSLILNKLLNNNLLSKVYNKLLYMKRNKIDGHTILAVYEKMKN